MKFSHCSFLVGLAATALAEDLLFVDTFEYDEYFEATTTLGMTAKVVSVADWATMSTADFAAFKAIVIADPDCSSDPSILQFLVDSKNTWGPAVQGNMVIIGKTIEAYVKLRDSFWQEPIRLSMMMPEKLEL
jgi:hypothetical protein